MNFELNNKHLGNWLAQLNGKTVGQIFQVDFINDRYEDDSLPWILFLTFTDLDKYLEIKGDFDGTHIRIDLGNKSQLDRRLKENDFPHDPSLWRIYLPEENETISKLVGQKIDFVEYGIDKDEFEISGTKFRGEKTVFTFIRFNCYELCITIVEGSGLFVSGEKDVEIPFAETFDWYDTR